MALRRSGVRSPSAPPSKTKNSVDFRYFDRAGRLPSHIMVPRAAALLWNGLARFLSRNPETQRDSAAGLEIGFCVDPEQLRYHEKLRQWPGLGRERYVGFRVPVAPIRHRCAKLLMAGSGPYRKSDLPPPKHRFACFPTVRFPGPAGKKQTSYQHRYGVPEVMPQDRKQQAAGPEPQPDGDERGKRRQGHGECVEGELTVRESEGVRHAEQKA